MSQTIDTVNGLVKQMYDDNTITKQFNDEAVLFNKIKTDARKPAGDGLFINVHLQGNERGQGSQNMREALRQPADQSTVKGRILNTIFTHTIGFPGLEVEAVTKGDAAFANSITFKMDEGLKDSKKELNSQLYRDGSGRLAQVNGAVLAGNTDIVVDNGILTHFRRGMFLDFYFGGSKQVAGAELADVDIPTSTVILKNPLPAGVSDNADIYRESVNDSPPADGKELLGLPIVTDDGSLSTTYLGIDRTTTFGWDGVTLNAAGVNLSNDLLQRSISRNKILNGGKTPNKIVSNTQQMRKYLDILTPLKRFDSKGKMDSGDVEVPTWNGKEWIEDTDCGFSEVYGINTEYISKFELRGLHWDSLGNGDVIKWDNGFDAFVAYAKYYGNVASRMPNAHFRLINLAVPTF